METTNYSVRSPSPFRQHLETTNYCVRSPSPLSATFGDNELQCTITIPLSATFGDNELQCTITMPPFGNIRTVILIQRELWCIEIKTARYNNETISLPSSLRKIQYKRPFFKPCFLFEKITNFLQKTQRTLTAKELTIELNLLNGKPFGFNMH